MSGAQQHAPGGIQGNLGLDRQVNTALAKRPVDAW